MTPRRQGALAFAQELAPLLVDRTLELYVAVRRDHPSTGVALQAYSGKPVNITTGLDSNGDGMGVSSACFAEALVHAARRRTRRCGNL